jgi:hypothetical protein
MDAVGLNEIGKPARTSDARDGRYLLVMKLALLDELEVKRQHREIAATGTPRRMVGGDFFLRERFALGIRQRRNRCQVAPASRNVLDGNRTHNLSNC